MNEFYAHRSMSIVFLSASCVASCAAQPPPPTPIPVKITIDRAGLWDEADDPVPPSSTLPHAAAPSGRTTSTWYCFYIAKVAEDDYGACRRDEARCNALSAAVPGDDKLPCTLRVGRIKTILHFTAVRPDKRELDIGTLTQRSCEWWRDSYRDAGYGIAHDHCHGEGAK